MKHLCTAGGAVLLIFTHLTFATISNWTFENAGDLLPTDSIGYAYQSDRDTTMSRIYLETGEANSGLDTNSDMLLFTITMIDNNTMEKWGENGGLMADRNPAEGAYLFSPGRAGLAPALYIVALSDEDTMVTDTFRTVGFIDPYRTVSGTVVPPEGKSAAFINVSLYGDNLNYSLSALTDQSGAYSIGIDQATIEQTAGMITVRTDSRYPGFITTPPECRLDLSVSGKSGADFKYVKTTSAVKGTIRSGNGTLENMRVVLQTPQYNEIAGTMSAADGSYFIDAAPGTYLLRVNFDKNEQGYLSPREIKVELKEGDTTLADITIPVADAYVYGRVTVKGAAPSFTLGINAYNEQYGGNWTTTNAEGYFSIPVIAAAGTWNVNLENSDKYPVPQQYIIENGKQSMQVNAGDSAFFNLIDKPSGGISGTLVNASSCTTERFFISLFDTAKQNGSYYFETKQGGAYTFIGIPAGTYFADAGMNVTSDGSNRKLHRKYTDTNGIVLTITVGTAIVPGIDFKFTDSDTVGNPEEVMGDAVLFLTILDSTDATIEKGSVMVYDHVPVNGEQIKPLRYFSIEGGVDKDFQFTGIPNKPVFVAVELAGKANEQFARYMTFVIDNQLKPRRFDFVSFDTLQATAVLYERNRCRDDSVTTPKGNGIVAGMITNNSSIVTGKIMAALYDLKESTTKQGVPINSDGSYKIINIPAGKYCVIAVIDTNGDKNPEAITKSDSILVFTDAEIYTGINLTLTQKPAGSGSISGTIAGIDSLPQGTLVTVAAIPIDTTKPDSAQLNELAFLASYRSTMQVNGTYSIEGLPGGVYYVVAIAQVKDTSGQKYQAAQGVYGELLLNDTLEVPFDPKPVIVKEGQKTEGVVIMMIAKRNNDKDPVQTAGNVRLPLVFAMEKPVMNRSTGCIHMQIAVPVKAVITIALLDLRGRVAANMPQRLYTPGFHSIDWNISSTLTANGTYIVMLKSKPYRARHIVQIIR